MCFSASFRLDNTLEEIIFKLVPGLRESEFLWLHDRCVYVCVGYNSGGSAWGLLAVERQGPFLGQDVWLSYLPLTS